VQRNHIVVDTAVSLLRNIDIAYTRILDMRFLQTVEVKGSIFAHIGFNHLRSEKMAVVG